MLDLPAAVRRSVDAALLAESSIHAGHPEGIASLVGQQYAPPTVGLADVTLRPGESPSSALVRAGADAMCGYLSEVIVTLSIALAGWAEATNRTTEEIASELVDTVGSI